MVGALDTLKKHRYFLILVLIILAAIFWRFVNYDNRWTLSQDQARDAIIGLISLQTGNIPLIGPPSSVGQFSFGPIYYWLIIFFTSLAPNIVNAPWIGFTLLSLIPVILFFFIGRDLKDNNLGLILALIAAFASAPVFHSVDMLNPIPVSIATSLVIFSLVRLIEKRQIIYSLLLGLSIGLAISFHYQALGLLLIPIIIFFAGDFKGQKRWLVLWGSIGGALIALAPLIIFNFQVGGALVGNFLNFSSSSGATLRAIPGFFKDLIVFWPQLIGEILVFNSHLGYLFYFSFIGIMVWGIYKKWKFEKSFWIIFLSLMAQAILLRLYGGARSSVYLIVFYPFIIFLTGWTIWKLIKFQKYLGLGLLGVFLLVSSFSNFNIIKGHTQKPLILQIKKLVDEKHTQLIDLYTVRDSGMISLPIYYLLLKENRISTDGYKIGTCGNKILENGVPLCPTDPAPFYGKENLNVFDINTIPEENIIKGGFERLTSEEIYSWLYDYYE